MTRCPKCGNIISENNRYCPVCGFSLNMKKVPARPNNYNQQYQNAGRYQEQYVGNPDYTDRKENKVLCMFMYLNGLFGVLIAMLERRSDYVRFHVRQVLRILVAESLVNIMLLVLSSVETFLLFGSIGSLLQSLSYINSGYGFHFKTPGILSMIFAVIVTLLILGLLICRLILFVLKIIGFVSVCQGKMEEIPILKNISFF